MFGNNFFSKNEDKLDDSNAAKAAGMSQAQKNSEQSIDQSKSSFGSNNTGFFGSTSFSTNNSFMIKPGLFGANTNNTSNILGSKQPPSFSFFGSQQPKGFFSTKTTMFGVSNNHNTELNAFTNPINENFCKAEKYKFSNQQFALKCQKKYINIQKNIKENKQYSLSIKKLRLSNCNISNNGLSKLINESEWPVLQCLQLSLNQISEINCMTEQKLPNITWLTLMSNRLDTNASKFLSQRFWKKLQKLSISFIENAQQNWTILSKHLQQKFPALNTLWAGNISQLQSADVDYINNFIKQRSGVIYWYSNIGWLIQHEYKAQDKAFQNNQKQDDTYCLSQDQQKMISLYKASMTINTNSNKSNFNNQTKIFEFSKQPIQNFKSIAINNQKCIKWLSVYNNLMFVGKLFLQKNDINKAFQSFQTALQIVNKIISEKQKAYKQKFKNNPFDNLIKTHPLQQILAQEQAKLQLKLNSIEAKDLYKFQESVTSIQELLKNESNLSKNPKQSNQIDMNEILIAVVYREKKKKAETLYELGIILETKQMRNEALKRYFEAKAINEQIIKVSYMLKDVSFGFKSNIEPQPKQEWQSINSFQFSASQRQKQYKKLLKRILRIIKQKTDEASILEVVNIEQILLQLKL